MEFKPLPEQEDIISSQNKNLIVSASAGSGKTTVMIERISKLICSGKVTPKNLLVLTYTTSASSEMKQKLYNNLRNSLVENKSQILEEIAVADISTIHSFCSRLIKKYFHILGISPNFKIFDEGQSIKIKNQIITNSIINLANNNFANYISVMKNFAPNRKYESIVEIISKLNIFSQSFSDRNQFKSAMLYLYQNPNLAEEILNNQLVNYAEKFLSKANFLLKKTVELEIDKYSIYLNDISSNLSKIQKNSDFFDNFNVFSTISLPKFYKDKNVDSDLSLEIDCLKDDIKDYILSLKSKNFGDRETIKQSLLINQNLVNILLDIEEDFYNSYNHYKNQNTIMDYADLEEKATVLCENENIREELKQKYKYVFVDEYQDTNEIQDKLISLICGKDNRFMVGDVKQSIYGFRRSKPEIFLQIEKHYKTDKNSDSKYLNVNFRSDKEILNFVNYVFANIMTEITGGIDYKQNGKFEGVKTFDLEFPKVNIAVLDKNTTSKDEKVKADNLYDLEQHQSFNKLSRHQKEAYMVAKEILYLKNQKIKDGNKLRDIRYNDITILVRKRGDGYKEFCDKLVEVGIPIYASTGTKIIENPESQKFINLLKTCISIYDDIPLVSTMVSYFDFSEEEFATIRLANNTEKYFHNCIFVYMQNEDDLAKKIQSFYNQILKLQKDIMNLGGYQAINTFFANINYFDRLQTLNDETRIEILKKMLVELHKDEYNFNLPLFVDTMLKDGKLNTPDFSSGDSDFVNISTIHSSKGLEFPIVFVVDTGADFNKTRVEQFAINDKLGLGMKYYDQYNDISYNSVVCEAIKGENKKQEFAEKLRLLYVALTRAKNVLYIVGSADLNNIQHINSDFDILEQNTYMNLILSSFEDDILNKLRFENQFISKINESNICFKKYEDEFLEISPRQILSFADGDKKLEKEFLERLNTKSANNSMVALKNSVSSILNEEYNISNQVLSIDKLTVDEHLRQDSFSTNQGIEYHSVLQRLDFLEFKNANKLKQISNDNNLDFDRLQTNLKVLYELFGENSVFKEKQFIMKVRYCDVTDSKIEDEILVQGVIDAFCLTGEKCILVDYKLTNKTAEKIKERYKKQLQLYSLALQKAFNKKSVEAYILNLTTSELIRM